MKIFRSVLSGFAAFICASSIVGLVYLFTLQATILDRTVVKDWLSDSKIYEGNLAASLIQPSASPEPATVQPAITTTPEMIKTALSATFTPDFVRSQTEKVIDNTYDWVEGKNPKFTFAVPVDQKRDTFIQQLSKTLESQVAVLPICGTAQTTVCRPANTTVEQLTRQMTTESLAESGMFTSPLTPATFTQNSQQPISPLLAELPTLRQLVDLLFIILPILIVLGAVAVILIAAPGAARIFAAAKLSRRVFFSMLFTLATAAVVMFFLKDNDFGLSKMFAAQIGDLIVPLIKIIILDVAFNLVVFSGIAAVVCGVSWAGLTVWQSKIKSVQTPKFPSKATRY